MEKMEKRIGSEKKTKIGNYRISLSTSDRKSNIGNVEIGCYIHNQKFGTIGAITRRLNRLWIQEERKLKIVGLRRIIFVSELKDSLCIVHNTKNDNIGYCSFVCQFTCNDEIGVINNPTIIMNFDLVCASVIKVIGESGLTVMNK
jgi:hypothetical protein